MIPHRRFFDFALLALLAVPGPALARGLSVEVWTDRGTDGVYRAGDPIRIEARTSDDAYLLVYEIDAQGYVHVLHPTAHGRGFVEGRRSVTIPDQDSDFELSAQGPDGLGYVVAIASLDPFLDLPWYLRPYDPQAAELGYAGRDDGEDEADGVSAEGHIVGDPFVAMERIRRRLIRDPNDGDAFASSYTSYYVGHQVRYPRYLCADCHRSNQWSWWDGFDPYYTTCSVFDFRVNWGWTWGPTYWTGFVPYYVYTYRADCPPRWRRTIPRGGFYSSWDGWRRWNSLWSGGLRRFKGDPPTGYVPPDKWGERRRDGGSRPNPPGYLGGGRAPGTAIRVPRGQTTPGDRGIDGRSPREGNVVPGTPRTRQPRDARNPGGVAPEPVRVPVGTPPRGDRPPRTDDSPKGSPQRIDRPRNDPAPPAGRPARDGKGKSSDEPRERKGRSAFVAPLRWFEPVSEPSYAPVNAPRRFDPPAYQPPRAAAPLPSHSAPPAYDPPRAAPPPPSQAPPPAVHAPAPAPAPSLPPGVQRLTNSIASKRGG